MLTNIPHCKAGHHRGVPGLLHHLPVGAPPGRRGVRLPARGVDVYECRTTVENERDMLRAVDEVKAAGCNALVVFLGNFGPETPETPHRPEVRRPRHVRRRREETGKDLIDGRGDAYCGMLNCSYNLGMRHLKAYIPEYPVGTAEDMPP